MKIQDLCEERLRPGSEHYLTPGRRIQCIGSQNGRFTAFGSHLFNEMGGVWMHPIKLLDGFWLGFRDEAGAIDWLTDAQIFSNHVFWNELIFEREGFRVTRKEFSAQNLAGLVVQFEIENLSRSAQKFEGVLTATTDLRPVWYSENAGIVDGKDLGHFDNTGLGGFYGLDFVARDADHDWFTRLRFEGADPTASVSNEAIGPDAAFGQGLSAIWAFDVELAAQETKTISLKITGSLTSQAETLSHMAELAALEQVFADKAAAYQEILDHSDLVIADKALEKQYAWSKCHIEWLTVDSEPVGIGLAAGIPNYSWWFGVDSIYALKGCLPAGFHDLAASTLAIIAEGSARANGNGRIIHEENSYGVVGNPGNTQETALFIHGIYTTFTWTGDLDWLRGYFTTVRRSLNWLLIDMDKDGDLFPEGFGVIEGRDLTGEVIDTAVYTAVALADAAQMAAVLGDKALSVYYQTSAALLSEKIRSEMWLPDEGLFADVRAKAADLAVVFDNALTHASHHNNQALTQELLAAQAKLASDSSTTDQVYCFKNWVIQTPIEMGLATPEQAERALARLNSDEFVGEWGTYLGGKDDARIMTISSAVQINSNLAYGHADAALDIIGRVMRTFNLYLPGSISEMSPDYGCFVQAWSAYAMISPMITGFLGLTPNACAKELSLAPCLPSDWQTLQLKNVKIGKESFDFELARNDAGYSVKVSELPAGWTLEVADNVRLETSHE